MTQYSFNKQVQPVRFDYKKAAMEACEMFPAETTHVLFGDVDDFSIIHSQGNNAAFEEQKHLLSFANHIFRMYRSSFCTWGQELGDNKYIFLYTEKDAQKYSGINVTRTHDLFFTFDHELAHVLGTQEEAVADTFAAMRHYQRFGVASRAIDGQPLCRALSLFLDFQALHFTSNVTEKVILMKDSLYLERLSPQDTFRLAKQVARQIKTSEDTIDDWRSVCEKTAATLRKAQDAETLFECLGKIIGIQDPIVAKWAYAVTSAILDGTITHFSQQHMIRPIPALSPAHAEDLRQRLDEKKSRHQELVQKAPVFADLKKTGYYL